MLDDWRMLLHTVATGIAAYAALIVWLRVTGKRTLSKWNAFDFVVTIAIGSMLATTTLSRDTTLAQGIVGFALFVLLQFAITWCSVRAGWLPRLLNARPRLLLADGEPLRGALVDERVTEGELCAAVRASGIGALEGAAAVVLETDGSFSVVRRGDLGNGSALADVARGDGSRHPPPARAADETLRSRRATNASRRRAVFDKLARRTGGWQRAVRRGRAPRRAGSTSGRVRS